MVQIHPGSPRGWGDAGGDVLADVSKEVGNVLSDIFKPVGKAIGALDIPTPNVNIGVSDTVYAGIRARNAASAARGVQSYHAGMEAQTARDQAKNAADESARFQRNFDARDDIIVNAQQIQRRQNGFYEAALSQVSGALRNTNLDSAIARGEAMARRPSDPVSFSVDPTRFNGGNNLTHFNPRSYPISHRPSLNDFGTNGVIEVSLKGKTAVAWKVLGGKFNANFTVDLSTMEVEGKVTAGLGLVVGRFRGARVKVGSSGAQPMDGVFDYETKIALVAAGDVALPLPPLAQKIIGKVTGRHYERLAVSASHEIASRSNKAGVNISEMPTVSSVAEDIQLGFGAGKAASLTVDYSISGKTTVKNLVYHATRPVPGVNYIVKK